MPIVQADRLTRIGAALLKAAGASDEEEVEYIREQRRKVSGIDVEDATWDRLQVLAGEYKLATELDLA